MLLPLTVLSSALNSVTGVAITQPQGAVSTAPPACTNFSLQATSGINAGKYLSPEVVSRFVVSSLDRAAQLELRNGEVYLAGSRDDGRAFHTDKDESPALVFLSLHDDWPSKSPLKCALGANDTLSCASTAGTGIFQAKPGDDDCYLHVGPRLGTDFVEVGVKVVPRC